MPRSTTILPISSTQLEIDLLDTFIESLEAHIGSPIPIKFLWNPDECPFAFLKYLAAAFSVDGNIADYSEQQLRTLIKQSIPLHRIKGTVGSIYQAVEALGYQVDALVEGDRDPRTNEIIRTDGRWAHFSVSLPTPIPIKAANAAVSLIESIAPVSRKLVLFSYTQAALRYDGGINSDGTYTFFSDGTYTHGEVNSQKIVNAKHLIFVPTAPTNVTATAGDRQITLSWQKPSSDGGSAITGYRVRLGRQAWIRKGASDTSHQWTNLTNGTEYTLHVQAENAAGFSSSASVQGTPATVPTAPRSLTTTAGDGQITLSWQKPSSDGGSPLTGYRVRVGTGAWISKSAAATSHTFTGLTNGTAYTVFVQAQNTVGSSTSATAMATPVAPIPWTQTWRTLTGVRVRTGSVGQNQLRIKTSRGSSGTGILTTYTLTTLQGVKAIQIHVTDNKRFNFIQALSTNKKLRIYASDAKWVEYEILAFRGGTPMIGKTWWINLNYETSSTSWTNTDPSMLNIAISN